MEHIKERQERITHEHIDGGFTVKKLLELLQRWPKEDSLGEDTEVWIGNDDMTSSVATDVWLLNDGDVFLEANE